MKQFTAFLFSIFLMSCTYSSFLEKDYSINQGKMVTVGSPIISWALGKEEDGKKEGMKKELIYGGVSQGVLQFTYREYEIIEPMGTYARPAFSQDLKYDVPSDSIITYKDVIFKIHSFSGQRIQYTVIQDPAEVKNYKPSSGLSTMGYYAIIIPALLVVDIIILSSIN
ncbi:MAG: hypothetical protein AB1728_15125 [Bacteroidota bacterium]